MPLKNMTQQDRLKKLTELRQRREEILLAEKQWVEDVNFELERSFILPFAAEAVLRAEIKWASKGVDINESAADTIERLMDNG